MTADVTIVTALYGTNGHSEFLPRWLDAVRAVDPAPRRLIISSDRSLYIDGVTCLNTESAWKHPQAWYYQQAVDQADTEWVWTLDVDDAALPDSLAGIDAVEADVWQMGYVNGRNTYIVPDLTNDEYLAKTGNCYVGSSAFRTEAFHHVGGFDDLGYQDWGLWRKMCKAGLVFQSSGRANLEYLEPHMRTVREFNTANRVAYLAEMAQLEAA